MSWGTLRNARMAIRPQISFVSAVGGRQLSDMMIDWVCAWPMALVAYNRRIDMV